MRVSTRRLQLTEEDRRFEVTLPGLLEAGNWEAVFGSSGPLTLEIGLGKDTHLAEVAERHPEQRFVGLEISRKKFDMVLKKLGRRGGPENLRLLHADATRVLEAAFPPAGLERVYLLFPDPWPKVRHERRRIIAPEFLSRLLTRMAPGATLEIRTDNEQYLEQIVEVLSAEPGLRNRVPEEEGKPYLLEPLDAERHVPTLFERKFRERGLPIHHFYFARRTDEADGG